MRILGIDPGSIRTGYGCIETVGSRHRVVECGAIALASTQTFSEKLLTLHTKLADLLSRHQPDAMAVEDLFHAKNARSALKLGHVRGVVLLAGSQAGIPIAEYTATEVKRAVVGYGRAEKQQVQQMIMLLLGLDRAPTPFDVSDALAVAICHAHAQGPVQKEAANIPLAPRSWRRYRAGRVGHRS